MNVLFADAKQTNRRKPLCPICVDEHSMQLHTTEDFWFCEKCDHRLWVINPCNCRSLQNLSKNMERKIKKQEVRIANYKQLLGEFTRKYPEHKSKRRHLQKRKK